MNRYGFLALIFALSVAPVKMEFDWRHAQAQPAVGGQPDPAFMTKVIQVLQQQRNNAQDQLTAEQARRLMVEEENTKLKGELEVAKKSPPTAKAVEPAKE